MWCKKEHANLFIPFAEALPPRCPVPDRGCETPGTGTWMEPPFRPPQCTPPAGVFKVRKTLAAWPTVLNALESRSEEPSASGAALLKLPGKALSKTSLADPPPPPPDTTPRTFPRSSHGGLRRGRTKTSTPRAPTAFSCLHLKGSDEALFARRDSERQ